MSAVDQKRHDGCCGKTQPFCENPYKGKLHGTGIDKETDEKDPAGSKTGLLEKEAKGNSKKNISQKNRDCFIRANPAAFFIDAPFRIEIVQSLLHVDLV